MDELSMQDHLQLVGQVAAITGRGQGIGRAFAATLSPAAATTAVLARNADSSDAGQSIRIEEIVLQCDASLHYNVVHEDGSIQLASV